MVTLQGQEACYEDIGKYSINLKTNIGLKMCGDEEYLQRTKKRNSLKL